MNSQISPKIYYISEDKEKININEVSNETVSHEGKCDSCGKVSQVREISNPNSNFDQLCKSCLFEEVRLKVLSRIPTEF